MSNKTPITNIDEYEKRRAMYTKVFRARFLYYMDQRYVAAATAIDRAKKEAFEFMVTAFGTDWVDV